MTTLLSTFRSFVSPIGILKTLIWALTPKVAENKSSYPTNKKVLRKQLTSIGRFSLVSQTDQNPSVISFFVALAHETGKDMNADEFSEIWEERVMKKYDRFGFQVSSEDDRYFEENKKPANMYFSNTEHPIESNEEFPKRIQSMLLSPFDVTQGLWEAQLSSGVLGTSGALSKEQFKNDETLLNRETLVLFRVHHSLCDGISLSVAIGNLADESEELRRKICTRQARNSSAFTLLFQLKIFVWYLLNLLFTLLLQLWRVATASSPFDIVLSASKLPPGTRSIAWRSIDSLQEVKSVSKLISPSATVNDLTVHLVAYAIRRQLVEHDKNLCKDRAKKKNQDTETVNVVIPVHLNGGILREGENIGNKIGAFVATIPLPRNDENSTLSARAISHMLQREKSSPAPLISWILAKFISDFTPNWFSKYMIRKFNAKAVAVISNIKGWPIHVHWLGRKVGFLCAFLPLPPCIPIGVVIQSYDGNVSFSINADKRAVPDANMFAMWMLEEYQKMKRNQKQ